MKKIFYEDDSIIKKILNSIGCDELSEEEKERSMSSEFDYLEED